jgi:hypothetical protein
MKKLMLAAVMAACLAFAGGASAAPTTTFGGATVNADGSVLLNSSASPFVAGIDLSVPGGTFVGDLTAFSTDYNFANGCPNGVPKLAIGTPRGTISISLAWVSGFSCASGTHSAYVLNATTQVDTGQILGGTSIDTWGHAKSEYDNLRVNSVQLVTTGANQTVTVANVLLVINQGAPTASL